MDRDGRMTCRAGCLAAAIALMPGSPAQAENAGWRHGVLEPKSDSGIVLMAARHGFFAQYGLDVEIVGLKNEMIEQRAAVSGDLDSFEGSPPFAANATGAKLRTVGCYWTVSPYHIFAKQNIRSIADMRGKTIAIAAPGSAPDMVARAIFAFHGLPVDSVNYANVGGDADRYRAVVQGVVDATVVSGEYTPIAAQDGLHSIAVAREALPDYDRICISMNDRALTTRRADAARFLAGEMAGLRYALAHRDETIALSHEIAGQKLEDPRAAWIFDDAVATKSVDPSIPLSAQRMAAMQALMVSSGALGKPARIDELIDLKLREEALALVKP